MNIDDVARRMTNVEGPRGWRGPSGPAFTARVMAPIHGRPQPGFTARVMNRLDEPAARGRSFSSGAWRALILIPAAIALAAGTSVLTRGAVRMPSLPGAPALATNASTPRMPDAPALRPVGRVSHAIPNAVPAPQAEAPELPTIYRIAALEGPADIPMKSIEPAACTIPALDAPAPLKVPDLPASGGGSQKESKEKS